MQGVPPCYCEVLNLSHFTTPDYGHLRHGGPYILTEKLSLPLSPYKNTAVPDPEAPTLPLKGSSPSLPTRDYSHSRPGGPYTLIERLTLPLSFDHRPGGLSFFTVRLSFPKRPRTSATSPPYSYFVFVLLVFVPCLLSLSRPCSCVGECQSYLHVVPDGNSVFLMLAKLAGLHYKEK